jgi:plastocyanin
MKRLTTLLAIAALAIAGCGGDDDNEATTPAAGDTGTTEATETASGGGGGTDLQLTTGEGLKYDKTSLSASAGQVTLTFKNGQSLSHNVSVKGNGVDEDGEVVGEGGTSTVTADLKAGSYTFYCEVDGHEAAGMKGTLTVK